MSISRRELLKLGTGTAAMLLAGTKPLSAMANWAGEKIPIGLQLYSVRQDCEKDLASVLQAVAKMGYQGVEFAGYYNRSATELARTAAEAWPQVLWHAHFTRHVERR